MSYGIITGETNPINQIPNGSPFLKNTHVHDGRCAGYDITYLKSTREQKQYKICLT